jgi:hypothetical protein
LRPAGVPPWIPEGWEDDLGADPLGHRPWSGFFFFTGVATFLAAAKHGFPHFLAGFPLFLTTFATSLAAGLGTLHAEVSTIQARLEPGPLRRWLRRGALGKFALFVLAITLDRSFLVVIVNAALGLGPVMVSEYLAFRRGNPGSGWVAGGLALSVLTALIYLVKLSANPWFDQNDLAHLLMMVSLLMIYWGVRVPARPGSSAPEAA